MSLPIFLAAEGRNAEYPPWLIAYVQFLATLNSTNQDEPEQMQSSNPSQLGEDLVQLIYDAILKFGPEYNLTLDQATHAYEDFVMGCHYERIPCDKR